MTDAPKKIVVTLLAEKGKKYDETRQCISSHEGSIVFLPRDVSIGQICRVELKPVSEKKDARGATMYQAQHTWFDLGRDERCAIAREAEILRSCATFGEREALALLAARFGKVLDGWKGYSHYYFHTSGTVYASKYSPASLLLLESAARAPWRHLVEPLLWISAGVKPVAGDLFALRQEGKEIEWRFPIPQLTDEEIGNIVGRIEKGEILLSAPLVEVGSSGRLRVPGWEEDEWRTSSPPVIPIPDFAADATATVPKITEWVYGRGPNGEALVVYGVLTWRESWGLGITFAPAWKKTKEDAETVRYESSLAVARLREQLEVDRIAAAKQAELDRIRAEEDALRRAEAEAARIAAEAEAARKIEENARMQAEVGEAEKRGEKILRDFRAYVRRSGTQQGDGWVIAPDGSLREPDEVDHDHPRGFRYRHKIWRIVGPTELALVWRDGQCEIAYRAAGRESTPEQLATIREIEREVGLLPGAFGLDPAIASGRRERSDAKKTPPRAEPEYWATSEAQRRADQAGEVDPTNPFAKLAALKKKLQENGKD